MRRHRAVATLGLSLAAAVARPARIAAQTAPEKIRVVSVITEPVTAVFYAIKSRIFERLGLDVELIPISSGASGDRRRDRRNLRDRQADAALDLRCVPARRPGDDRGAGFVHTPAHPNSLLQIASMRPIRPAPT